LNEIQYHLIWKTASRGIYNCIAWNAMLLIFLNSSSVRGDSAWSEVLCGTNSIFVPVS